MGLVKRKASTMKITAEVFEDLKVQFLTDIETVSMSEDIPKDLDINWNQMAPVSNWTQEVKGTKRAAQATQWQMKSHELHLTYFIVFSCI